MKKYINKRTKSIAEELTSTPYKIAGVKWYLVRQDSDSFTIPASLLEGSCDWEELNEDDEWVWTTSIGEKIKYKDITQQHWSNIYHEAMKEFRTSLASQATAQIIKRFDGVILDYKEIESPIILTTYDGVKVIDPNKQLFIYNNNYPHFDSVLAKNAVYLQNRGFLFSSEEAREDYVIMNTRLLSIQDIMDIRYCPRSYSRSHLINEDELTKRARDNYRKFKLQY